MDLQRVRATRLFFVDHSSLSNLITKVVGKVMSSAAAKAEARRKAILARGSDRLSKLTSSARGEDNPVYANIGERNRIILSVVGLLREFSCAVRRAISENANN